MVIKDSFVSPILYIMQLPAYNPEICIDILNRKFNRANISSCNFGPGLLQTPQKNTRFVSICSFKKWLRN